MSLVFGWLWESSAAPRRGGTYRRALLHRPQSLDPARATTIYAATVIHQVFDGLVEVEFDSKLGVRPALAEFWDASEDGRVWTFQLRQGARFHHGREMMADDVIYSLTRILDPRYRSPWSGLFNEVQGVDAFRMGRADHVSGFEILGPHLIRITLKEPYAPFVHQLGVTAAKIVPRDEVQRLGEAFGRQPVGTGPFRFAAWEGDGPIRLQAHEAYFGQRPYLDQIHFRIFPSGKIEDVWRAFERRELEETKIPIRERQRILADKASPYQFVEKPLFATLFLLLDTQPGPLQHVKVRQAINYAIDREAINRDIRQNRFQTAQGILPLQMPGFNFQLQGYAYDLERARQLMAEAGYPDGKGLGPIELWTASKSETVQQEHAAIKQYLEQIGLTVRLHTASSWKAYKRDIIGKRPGGMYRYAWYADFPDPYGILHPLFYSKSEVNYSHYANAEVDRLIDQARREMDQSKRFRLYNQAEVLIMQDAPTVNIVYYEIERLFQPYVKGLDVRSMREYFTRMERIWLER